MSDSQGNKLLELATRAARDDAAFQELYEMTKAYVAAVIRRTASAIKNEDLWDVLQGVYLKLLLALERGQCRADSDDGFRGWLAGIAHNETVDWIRRESRHVKNRVELDSTSAGWLSVTLSNAKAECVQDVLELLDADSARLLHMRYVDCYTCPEIAQQLNLELPLVNRRLHQARERFRELWAVRSK